MRFFLFLAAFLMLLYLIGSAFALAPITLLVAVAVIISKISGTAYGQLYSILVVIYIIVMFVLFFAAFTLPSKKD